MNTQEIKSQEVRYHILKKLIKNLDIRCQILDLRSKILFDFATWKVSLRGPDSLPLPLYKLKRLKRLWGPLLRCPRGGCGAIFVKGLGKSSPKSDFRQGWPRKIVSKSQIFAFEILKGPKVDNETWPFGPILKALTPNDAADREDLQLTPRIRNLSPSVGSFSPPKLTPFSQSVSSVNQSVSSVGFGRPPEPPISMNS